MISLPRLFLTDARDRVEIVTSKFCNTTDVTVRKISAFEGSRIKDKSKASKLLHICANKLAEVIWSHTIAGDARTILVNNVGTLVHLTLQSRIVEREALSFVDGLDIDVLESDSWTWMICSAVHRCSNIVLRGTSEISPTDILQC
jgi:hypothetical protein